MNCVGGRKERKPPIIITGEGNVVITVGGMDILVRRVPECGPRFSQCGPRFSECGPPFSECGPSGTHAAMSPRSSITSVASEPYDVTWGEPKTNSRHRDPFAERVVILQRNLMKPGKLRKSE